MDRADTNNLIKEYSRLMEVLDKDTDLSGLIDMTPLAYVPYISKAYAEKLPDEVIGSLYIWGQPFYCQDYDTLVYMKARLARIKAKPGLLDRIRNSVLVTY